MDREPTAWKPPKGGTYVRKEVAPGVWVIKLPDDAVHDSVGKEKSK